MMMLLLFIVLFKEGESVSSIQAQTHKPSYMKQTKYLPELTKQSRRVGNKSTTNSQFRPSTDISCSVGYAIALLIITYFYFWIVVMIELEQRKWMV
jgi:hypothetical protein